MLNFFSTKSKDEKYKKQLTPTMNFINGFVFQTHNCSRKKDFTTIDILGCLYDPSPQAVSESRQVLEYSWGIKDAKGFYETLEWLIKEGLTEPCREAAKIYIKNPLAIPETDRAVLEKVINHYPEESIIAWDCVRAAGIAFLAVNCRYITYEESIKIAVDMCRKMQQCFNSWEEMLGSYFYGLEYWGGNSPERVKERISYSVSELKKPDGVYSADWHTPLSYDDYIYPRGTGKKIVTPLAPLK